MASAGDSRSGKVAAIGAQEPRRAVQFNVRGEPEDGLDGRERPTVISVDTSMTKQASSASRATAGVASGERHEDPCLERLVDNPAGRE